MTVFPAACPGTESASFVRGRGDALLAVVVGDTDDRDGFAVPLADDLAARPECRVTTFPSDLLAVDLAAVAAMLRPHGRECAQTLVIGHGAGASLATDLAAEIPADAILLVAPAWSREQDTAERLRPAAPAIPTSAVTGAERAGAWLERVPLLDEQQLPLASAALPVALRQSGAMDDILTAMIAAETMPELTALIDRWRRRCAYRIELAGPVHCSPAGEMQLRGRIINTGETTLVFGRQSRDRLLIGARIRPAAGTAWTSEARALPAHPALDPGDSAKFVIGLAGAATITANDVEIELSLVSEGAFWYCDLGFPDLRLGSNASSEGASGAPAPRPDDPPDTRPRDRTATDHATLDDLTNCYRLILGRAPDPEGFAYYAQLVQAGIARGELVLAFISAPEAVARFDALRQARHHEDPTG